MAVAYYNEIDACAAQWLRNLIAAGHIAPGDVDERSIEDVHPDDLKQYTQCHFFAGIGAWSYALRRAKWSDDVRVWTGSCPCQPFSAAGAGAGFADERHLWPAFNHLISECRPSVVFGEQVASKAVEPWVDLVHADLEALGYAFGAVPFPSAGVGAPHIRDRLFWLGDANDARLEGHPRNGGSTGRAGSKRPASPTGVSVRLANLHSDGCNQRRIGEPQAWNDGVERNSTTSWMVDAKHPGHGGSKTDQAKPSCDESGIRLLDGGHSAPQEQSGPGPTNGFWADADWLFCRDGKWRPVEPGTFPLANGAASRVGRLRAYGNAINVEAATQFIAAFMETQQ